MGNAAALAMSQVREVAGTGSAVLGFTQFALGALVSPLVGLGGEALRRRAGAGDGHRVGARLHREPGRGCPQTRSASSTSTATS